MFNNDDKQTKMAIVCISLANKGQTIALNSLHTLVTKARSRKRDGEKMKRNCKLLRSAATAG